MSILNKRYFSDIGKTVFLQKGDLLFSKGDHNERLYLLVSGKIRGFDPEDEGEYFVVSSREFVGVNSFFSSSSVTRMSAVALEDSIVRYIERADYSQGDARTQLAADLMPTMILSLVNRQEAMHQMDVDRLRVAKEMQETERLAALGQLSAGIAHELNNAITVIARGSDQLSQSITNILSGQKISSFYEQGLKTGHVVTGQEARQKSKVLKAKCSFEEEVLRDYCRTGIEEQFVQLSAAEAKAAFEAWNMGATLRDLGGAAAQSEHVIHSMRSLAATDIIRQNDIDVNETLDNAIALLGRSINDVELDLQFGKLPLIYGNVGELVQVWTNLIKNAMDAMAGLPKEGSQLKIITQSQSGQIEVMIQDSGTGIPTALQAHIFEPRVTTKKQGQSYGLGLGLPIVKRVISRYSGKVQLSSQPGCTQFTVTLPVGEKKNEKTSHTTH